MKKTTLLVVSLLGLIFGTCKKQDTSGKLDILAYYQPFTTSAHFWDSIPVSATIDANSKTMVGSLIEQAD